MSSCMYFLHDPSPSGHDMQMSKWVFRDQQMLYDEGIGERLLRPSTNRFM